MLNQAILEILKRIQADTPQAFSSPRQVTAFLKDLTENNSQYNAVIRWLEISLADFDAYACIKGDYLESASKNYDVADSRIYNDLINEGASPDIAKEIVGYWAVVAGFTEESAASNNFDDVINAGIAYLESGDMANAIAYLTRASSGGSPLALYKLSVCHVDDGNMSEAFAHCKEAAETDVAAWPKDKETIALAQYQLAMYYGLGDGGETRKTVGVM